MRRTWISLAVAYHLGGNLKNAKITLESYINMVKVNISWIYPIKCKLTFTGRARLWFRALWINALLCPCSWRMWWTQRSPFRAGLQCEGTSNSRQSSSDGNSRYIRCTRLRDERAILIIYSIARLLSKLDSKSSAEEGWRSLIQRNPDCYDYYRELFKIKGFSLGEWCSCSHST